MNDFIETICFIFLCIFFISILILLFIFCFPVMVTLSMTIALIGLIGILTELIFNKK